MLPTCSARRSRKQVTVDRVVDFGKDCWDCLNRWSCINLGGLGLLQAIVIYSGLWALGMLMIFTCGVSGKSSLLVLSSMCHLSGVLMLLTSLQTNFVVEERFGARRRRKSATELLPIGVSFHATVLAMMAYAARALLTLSYDTYRPATDDASDLLFIICDILTVAALAWLLCKLRGDNSSRCYIKDKKYVGTLVVAVCALTAIPFRARIADKLPLDAIYAFTALLEPLALLPQLFLGASMAAPLSSLPLHYSLCRLASALTACLFWFNTIDDRALIFSAFSVPLLCAQTVGVLSAVFVTGKAAAESYVQWRKTNPPLSLSSHSLLKA